MPIRLLIKMLNTLEAVIGGAGPKDEKFQEGVQKDYLAFLNEGDIDSILAMRQVTKIEPQLPQEAIQKAYVRCARNGHFGWFERLKEFTHTELSEETAQECFRVCNTRKDTFGFAEMYTFTNFKPADDDLQYAYSLAIRKDVTFDFKKLLKLNTIKPTEEIVQQAYESFLLHRSFGDMKDLQKLTRVKLQLEDSKFLLRRQIDFIRGVENEVECLEDLQKVTGAELDLPPAFKRDLATVARKINAIVAKTRNAH